MMRRSTHRPKYVEYLERPIHLDRDIPVPSGESDSVDGNRPPVKPVFTRFDGLLPVQAQPTVT